MYGQTKAPRLCTKNHCGPMNTVTDPNTGIQFETCPRCGYRGYDAGEFEAIATRQLQLHGVQVTLTPQQAHQQYSQPQYHGGGHLQGGMYGGGQPNHQIQYGGHGIACPSELCHSMMQTILFPGTQIQVERCITCGYTGLDAGETEAIISVMLQQYGIRTQPVAQVLQHYAQPAAHRGTHMHQPLFGRRTHGSHGHHAPRRHGHGSYSSISGGVLGFMGFGGSS